MDFLENTQIVDLLSDNFQFTQNMDGIWRYDNVGSHWAAIRLYNADYTIRFRIKKSGVYYGICSRTTEF